MNIGIQGYDLFTAPDNYDWSCGLPQGVSERVRLGLCFIGVVRSTAVEMSRSSQTRFLRQALAPRR